jgi:hypothetical protein
MTRALAALLVLANVLSPQETETETELVTAIKGNAAKGFSYTIKPVADIPNFASARDELAGAVIQGEYAGGLFHAKDGMFEIYRKGEKVAVKTERGWLAFDDFISPLRLAIQEAFEVEDTKRWRKGNVTKGREALAKLIRLSHLVHRSDIERLTNLGGMFTSIKRAGSPTLEGKSSSLYEGDLTDNAAFGLLKGPFEELIKRGILSFENVSGVGRIFIQDGVVKKVHARAGGKYGFYNEDDNVHRKGVCVLDITAQLSKIGETSVEPPAEAAALLK